MTKDEEAMAKDEEQDERAAIVAARKTIRTVDTRARRCSNPICRRLKRCTSSPWLAKQQNHRTGCCPITTRAEWAVIDLGIHIAVNRAFKAVDIVRRETGETSRAASDRLIVNTPPATWERSTMMCLLRTD
jgi:hypothetical protein